MTPASKPPLPRPWLFVAALVAGVSYWGASHLGVSSTFLLPWKGSGVALLALWIGLAARERDGWLITIVLALGALGDMLLESAGLIVGAIAFLAGHLVAILLYLLNRRRGPAGGALIMTVATPLTAYLIARDVGIAVYATGLGGMAGAAWQSRFPRALVASGALMFVASDLLIFARLGVLRDSFLPDLLIWPLYLGGQAMIAYGVMTTLTTRRRNEDLHHRL